MQHTYILLPSRKDNVCRYFSFNDLICLIYFYIQGEKNTPHVVSSSKIPDELFYLSTITGNFLPQLGPRLTVRRRGAGVLPTVENSADDYDNLDDVCFLYLNLFI